ncbi:hypothetical protein CSUI_005733 [Cystoisospora suis]|uniref:Uncharacterized protein n=1 Tax=Cystoisospora suis TaxID=483139 RepID=A0A2C6KIV5_9APIC|nr:hypothetical protein CSUI_005733 [Cystoisospora suis]
MQAIQGQQRETGLGNSAPSRDERAPDNGDLASDKPDGLDVPVRSLLVRSDGERDAGWIREIDMQQGEHGYSLRSGLMHRANVRSDAPGGASVTGAEGTPERDILRHGGAEDESFWKPGEDSVTFGPLNDRSSVARRHARSLGWSARPKGFASRSKKNMTSPHFGKSPWLRDVSKWTRRMMAAVVFLLVVRTLIRCSRSGALSQRGGSPLAPARSPSGRRLSDAPDKNECQVSREEGSEATGLGSGVRTEVRHGADTAGAEDESDDTDDDRESDVESPEGSSDDDGEVDSELEEELKNLEILSRASRSTGTTPTFSPSDVADEFEENEDASGSFASPPDSILFSQASSGVRGTAPYHLSVTAWALSGAEEPGEQTTETSESEEGWEQDAVRVMLRAMAGRRGAPESGNRFDPFSLWSVPAVVPGTDIPFTSTALLAEAQRVTSDIARSERSGGVFEQASAQERAFAVAAARSRISHRLATHQLRQAPATLEGPAPLSTSRVRTERMPSIPEEDREDREGGSQ